MNDQKPISEHPDFKPLPSHGDSPVAPLVPAHTIEEQGAGGKAQPVQPTPPRWVPGDAPPV
jgi:hypothetical protein